MKKDDFKTLSQDRQSATSDERCNTIPFILIQLN